VFLLLIAGSILGAVIAFTGAMLWVGIGETYRLVFGTWGFALLAVLALGWLASRLADGGEDGRSTSISGRRASMTATKNKAPEDRATATTQRRYDRQASTFDLTEAPLELLVLGRLRRRLWKEVRGNTVLEVGVGTGKNLPHHSTGGRIVAVDLSPRMLRRAADRGQRLGRDVDFVLADAQRLPFRDGAFHAAAATFVFCSVPDPVAGLQEVRRVVRDEGQVHLLEHVRAQNPVGGWLMDLINPIAVRLTGANFNRDTVANVAKGGIGIDTVESQWLGLIKLARGSVHGQFAVGSHGERAC
jgi:ubiquinone/menaquinone biosynthesis C-methylase UbiE